MAVSVLPLGHRNPSPGGGGWGRGQARGVLGQLGAPSCDGVGEWRARSFLSVVSK